MKHNALLLILTFLAALTRIPGIELALREDEVPNFSWYAFVPWSELLFRYTDNNQHTLFIALARLSMNLFGENETAFRLPVLLAGIFSVPLLYNVTFLLFNSRKAAATASLLMIFSSNPIYYSQFGRAYSLTLFLGLAMAYTLLHISENNSWRLKYLVLPLLGLCMIVDLPSNAYFMAASAIFFAALQWNAQLEINDQFKQILSKISSAFSLTFLFVSGYIFLIFPDLRRGVKIADTVYGTQGPGFPWFFLSWFTDILKFLSDPWGPWVFLFFIYGMYNLRQSSRYLAFSGIFLVPLALSVILKTFGPPRIYIYCLPFVMMLVAVGLVSLVSNLIRQISISPNKSTGILAVLLASALAVQPALKLKDYYQHRFALKLTTIADSRQVLSYIDGWKESDGRPLFIIQKGNPVLSHYLGQKVLENNFRALKEGQMDRIIFIGDNSIPPTKYLVARNLLSETYQFQDDLFAPEKTFGNLTIYRLMRKPTRINLDEAIGDDGNHLLPENITNLKVERHSLLYPEKTGFKITNKSDKNIFLVLPKKILVPGEENDYTVLIFVQKYQKGSKVFLAQEYDLDLPVTGKPLHLDYGPPNTATFPFGFELNYYDGIFSIEEKHLAWKKEFPFEWVLRNKGIDVPLPDNLLEIRFTLYPLYKKKHDLFVGFDVANPINIFDGIQVWALSRSQRLKTSLRQDFHENHIYNAAFAPEEKNSQGD